jgi:hypothetical protein
MDMVFDPSLVINAILIYAGLRAAAYTSIFALESSSPASCLNNPESICAPKLNITIGKDCAVLMVNLGYGDQAAANCYWSSENTVQGAQLGLADLQADAVSGLVHRDTHHHAFRHTLEGSQQCLIGRARGCAAALGCLPVTRSACRACAGCIGKQSRCRIGVSCVNELSTWADANTRMLPQ